MYRRLRIIAEVVAQDVSHLTASLRRALPVVCLAVAVLFPRPGCAQKVSYQVCVHATYTDEQWVENALVTLVDPTGAESDRGVTSNSGDVLFSGLKPGTYQLKVSGPGAEPTSTQFDITSGIRYSTVFVRLKRTSPPGMVPGKGTLAAVATLNVPGEARKEAEKGYNALHHNDFKEAKEHFRKAIEVYPQYAYAYCGLGVATMKSGAIDEARTAFQRAINLDDHLVAAYQDLARLEYEGQNYSNTETLLEKSLVADPVNLVTLTMLARAELMQGKWDKAIAYARNVHSSAGHEAYALVHLIAAKAWEQKGDLRQAALEYEQFLTEAPHDENAERVRATLRSLQNLQH